MSKKLDLGSDDEETSLTINKDYANRYENWRRNEELQKLKDRYGDDAKLSEEESSSSESDVPEWTTGDEKTFFKALAALKSKDPSIYDKNCDFQSDSGNSETSPGPSKLKKTKQKAFLMKDYERNLIIERGGIVDSDDENISRKDPSYHEKLKKTKDEIKAALAEISDGDESDDLLKKRVKTDKEKKEDDDDMVKWLGAQKPGKGKEGEIVNNLKQIWMKHDLSESDKFLRDYILEKKYDASSDEEAIPTYDEIVNLDQAIEEEERMEQFEQKFNYRFEDPDQEFIKQYPRTINDTVRKTNEKRKEQREKYKERKTAEKQQRKEEILRLRSLKKKEIGDKLERLKKIAGKSDINFSIEDLEKDFDPCEYDKKMSELFENDEVPENEFNEELEKPVFSDFSSDEDFDYDDVDVTKNNKESKLDDDDEEEEEQKNEIQGERLRGRPEELKASRRKRKRNTKLMEAINKKKPLFDPNAKTFEEYFNEYYALNYEDIAKDGTINRFHYRTVPANDFGLTVDEILKSDDRSLNSWVSIKRVSAYRSEREEKSDLFAYRHKAKNSIKKRQILSTDFGGKKSKKLKEREEKINEEVKEFINESNLPSSEEKEEQIVIEQEEVETESKKKKTRRKKKNKSEGKPTEEEDGFVEPLVKVPKLQDTIKEEELESRKPIKKKDTSRKKSHTPRDKTLNVNDDRLRAYGLNPVKYHRSRIYGKKKTTKEN